MRITIVGGGPSGLYFAILMKQLDPANEITIIERDGPDDTFGWGIVFSDQTFSYLEENDRQSYAEITGSCETWDNVDVVHKDQKVTIRGNRFSGISRLAFLNILHARCRDLGVEIRFNINITDINELEGYDLLVGADGANSLVRRAYEEHLQPTLEEARNKYIWLGTRKLFHGLTLTFRQNEAGLFIAHSYKFDKTTSTFIVECSEETWLNAGLNEKTDDETCAYLAGVFENDLEGHALLSNNFVRWLNFLLVKNRRWSHENAVLLGDALHTAHFSIGSGTKLALEDSIALAQCFKTNEKIEDALGEFERTRKPVIDEYQEAAVSSLLMFENARELMHLDPLPFAYKLMTRSKKIDYEKLKRRDPEFIAEYDRWRAASKSIESEATLIERNKAVIQRLVEEGYNEGNANIADELFTADYSLHGPAGDSDIEKWKLALTRFHKTFPDYRLTVEDLIAEGDRVAWRWTMEGTDTGGFADRPPTGNRVAMEGINIERFLDGKIVESWSCSDHIPLMRALGLSLD